MIITIDGPAGVGKSSVASYLARELGILLLKSGSFYRALSLRLKNQYPSAPEYQIKQIVQHNRWPEFWQSIQKAQIYQDGEKIWLDGRDVTDLLQTPELDILTPQISAIPAIRRFINGCLRSGAQGRSLIAEGRDMGTVVFPQAQHKFFLEANPVLRAQRRQQQQPGSLAEIERQLELRDEIDRNKPEGALLAAKDARIIDTSYLTLAGVCQIIVGSLNETSSAGTKWSTGCPST